MSDIQNVYIVVVDIIPLEGSELWGVAKGALMHCIVPAESREEAVENAETVLKEDALKLVKVEECFEFVTMEYESKEEEEEYLELAKEARDGNMVVYGHVFLYNDGE